MVMGDADSALTRRSGMMKLRVFLGCIEKCRVARPSYMCVKGMARRKGS